jgi:hypothetical protein
VFNLNLSWDTCYPDWDFSRFSWILPGKCWGSTLIRPSPLPSTFFPVHHSFIILPLNAVQSKLLTSSQDNPTFSPKVVGWLVLMLHIQEVTSFNLDPDISYSDKVSCSFLPYKCWHNTLKQATTASFHILSSSSFMGIPTFNATPQAVKSCGWRMVTIQSNNGKMEWFKLYTVCSTNI